jgi:hypothetical protein
MLLIQAKRQKDRWRRRHLARLCMPTAEPPDDLERCFPP